MIFISREEKLAGHWLECDDMVAIPLSDGRLCKLGRNNIALVADTGLTNYFAGSLFGKSCDAKNWLLLLLMRARPPPLSRKC